MIVYKNGECLISKGSVVLVTKEYEGLRSVYKKLNKYGEIYNFLNKDNDEIGLIYIGNSIIGGLIFETTQDIKSNDFGRMSGGFTILHDEETNNFLLSNLSELDISDHIPSIKTNMNFLIKKFMNENDISFSDMIYLNEKAFKRHIRLNEIIS
jgi:hypothetical protein